MKTAPKIRLAFPSKPFAISPATANRFAVFAFGLFLALPLAVSLIRKPSPPENENRPLHDAPPYPRERWQLQSFPFVFDAYFADRTGFRKELLRLRRHAINGTLGDTTSDLVIPGRDGWLFMNVAGPSGLPAVQPDRRADLREWAESLEERRSWLAERGIKYVVVVAPEKSSVYPEFLPEWVRRHPPPDNTAILKETVPLVDPLPAILAAKATGQQLYFRKDSHWTDAGAFPAYTELGKILARELPGFRTKPIARFRPNPLRVELCDMARALGLPPSECAEDVTIYDQPDFSAAMPPNDELRRQMNAHDDRLRHIDSVVAECATGTGKAVFFHDSFGGNLVRMLASDFRRIVSAGTYGFPTNVIEAEKPDVVIQLFVARAPTMVKAMRLAP